MNRLKSLAFIFVDNYLYFFFLIDVGLLTFSLSIHTIYHFEMEDWWTIIGLVSMIGLLVVCPGIHSLTLRESSLTDYIVSALKPDYFIRIGNKSYEVRTNGNDVDIQRKGTSGVGFIIISFFKNIIISLYLVISAPVRILLSLFSKKYSRFLLIIF